MAISLASDFQIRDEEFNAGYIETLNKNINVFNQASGGTIRLMAQDQEGHYAKTRFFDRPSGLIARRDITSTASATASKLTQDEVISVKLNRKIGPVEVTRDSMVKIGRDIGEVSFLLGQQVAEQTVEDMMESALNAVEAALSGQSSVVLDANDSTLAHADLISALALFGDQASKIKTWAMHSGPLFDLMSANVTVASGNIAGMTLIDANVASLNRPILTVDSSNLQTGGTPDYVVLGLVEGAVTVTESERPYIVTDLVTGAENLYVRYQGESAHSVEVKGFKWDTTNGGINPTDATVGTATNWDLVVANVKDAAGVYIQVQS